MRKNAVKYIVSQFFFLLIGTMLHCQMVGDSSYKQSLLSQRNYTVTAHYLICVIYMQVSVLTEWVFVAAVVLGSVLFLLLVGICWCQCCPHSCCCYVSCWCCPDTCCCPRHCEYKHTKTQTHTYILYTHTHVQDVQMLDVRNCTVFFLWKVLMGLLFFSV